MEDAEGYVQPYADSPLDFEHVGEDVYLNLIKNAKRYFYISTPYLIITDEMNRELGLAAKRGVDVRIITPGVPDKRFVYAVTRSYYPQLVCNGVRIFEYQPGFIHAKQCVCDGESATVGTINLDYRSFYLHFECGVQLVKVPAIADITADFAHTFTLCHEVTETYRYSEISLPRQLVQSVLRLFAPIL
ncbi:phospholipase D-like domain-containing protein [Pseudoramibacter sp.]|uniref:phospholipase D-like domain-containing protein n=1 Tax=Pseudoramibacter sp. TaxID=2034862 RepID=UPI00345C0D36